MVLESDSHHFTAFLIALRRVIVFADKPSVFKGLAALEHPNRSAVKGCRFTPIFGKFVRCSLDAAGCLFRIFDSSPPPFAAAPLRLQRIGGHRGISPPENGWPETKTSAQPMLATAKTHLNV